MWTIASLETFQVSFSPSGKDHTSSGGSYVVSVFAVYDTLTVMLYVPISVVMEPVTWTVLTSEIFARSEARYSVYPSTVASFNTTWVYSMIVAFPMSVSRERSMTFPTLNVAAKLTLYCDVSAAVTVRVTVPSRDGVSQAVCIESAEDAFTLYVHVSPTCHVGASIGPPSGVAPFPGDPRFAKLAGPIATAAKATSAKAVARTLRTSGLRCIGFILAPRPHQTP